MRHPTLQRQVRWLARALLVAAALVYVKGDSVRAEPDYHRATHFAPLRCGIPANLPTLPESWTLEYCARPRDQIAQGDSS